MTPFSKEDLFVAKLTEYLALSFGVKPNTARLISDAATLHDVGKICVAEHILFKRGRLSPKEFEVMKNHTILGERILSLSPNLCGDLKVYATNISALHHEKWDGTGYWGCKGGEFPYYCQMVSVCDVYCALTSPARLYKSPWAPRDALDYIVSESGKSFCPDIVSAFRTLFVQAV